MTWTHWNCHLKPSSVDFCLSCGHFEWSHDQFKTILNLGPKLAKNGRKRPQMTKNGLNVWKVTSETISIGFLLLLRSFWVVTWLVCDNFEFGAKMAKNGRKWPQNDQKWPECLKSDWNWLIWYCHSSYRPILSTSANFIQQWGWTSQKSQFWHPEKFFMECHYRSYFIIFIHPKCKISEN